VYFAYFEDTLLSWRAHLQGYKVVRALDSLVRHEGSVTAWRQPGRALYYWERNKLLTLLICYQSSTLIRLLPLYLFDGLTRLARDLWLVAKRPGALPANLWTTARRYLAVARALLWMVRHPDEVGRLRRWIQSERRRPDHQITPMLSGKIFDDMAPTRGQSWANALSIAYCRLVGIPVTESEVKPRPHQV
jgi:GT2 family glycosyltransferase